VFSSLCPHQNIQHLEGARFEDLNIFFYNATGTLNKSRPPSLLRRIFLTNTFEPLEAAKRKHNARNTVKFISRNGEQVKEVFERSKLSMIEL
jgi:hypothetical protein